MMRSVKRRRINSHQRSSSSSKKKNFQFQGVQSRYEDDDIGKFSSESEDEVDCRPPDINHNDEKIHIIPQTQAVSKIHWSSDESDRDTTKLDVEDFNETVVIKPINSRHDETIEDCQTDDEKISQVTSEGSQQKNVIFKDNWNNDMLDLESLIKENTDEISFDMTPSPPVVKIIDNENQDLSKQQIDNNFIETVNNDENDFEGNSEKKSKRVKKGGILERFKKLMLREKSDEAFWKHGLKTNQNIESTIYLIVKNLSCSLALMTLQCNLLPELLDVNVIIPENKFKDLQVDTILQLHPPWKRMYNKDLKCVILLCAYHILPVSESIPQKTKAAQDLLDFYQKQLSSEQGDLQGDGCLIETTMQTNVEPTIDSPMTIIQSVELHSYLGKMQFTAILQRKCHKLQKKEIFIGNIANRLQSDETENIYSIVVQDNVGMLSEIIFENSKQKWNDLLAEGEVYRFSNLRLLKRRSHSNNTAFRSFVQQFIPTKRSLIETSSQLEDSGSQENVYNIPYSSYVFLADQHSSYHSTESNNKELAYHKPCVYCNSNMDDQLERISMYAFIIAISQPDQDTDIKNSIDLDIVLYVGSHDKDNVFVHKIKKLWKCPFPSDTIQRLNSPTAQNDLFNVFLKDIKVLAGRLTLDEYSKISLAENPAFEPCRKDSLKILCLSDDSVEGDLVLVEGIVCGIDEATALFWNICKCCRSTIESSPSLNRAFCELCTKECNIDQKFQLSVYLYVDTCSEISIHCKLLESTIRSFMSNPSETAFQGFQMNSIIQRSLGPFLCEVSYVDISANNDRQFVLQQLRQYLDT